MVLYSGGTTEVRGFNSLTLANAQENVVILEITELEPVPKIYSPWVNPGVDENPNYNKARQVEKWKQTFGQGVAGKDLLKKSGYHSVAGILVVGWCLVLVNDFLTVRFRPRPTTAVAANPPTARAPALAGAYAAFTAVIA